MKNSESNKFDLVHNISRLIGTKFIQIQVLATHEKRLKLGLLQARSSEVSKPRLKSNLLGKQDPSMSASEVSRII